MNSIPNFECHKLRNGQRFFQGSLPSPITLSPERFEDLWVIHPAEFHEIEMHGRTVLTPRWQQAYGVDYHYAGRTNRALPIPPLLDPFVAWGQAAIDCRLNGVLVNWYDGSRGHYIGPHRDSQANMVAGSPIVTISFGEERTFRLRPWPKTPGSPFVDFKARNGTVFVMPSETNRSWTHEVPASKKSQGRRISVTLRAFRTPEISSAELPRPSDSRT